MDHLKINNYLQGNGTDWILWHKNSSGASYMGGVKFEQQKYLKKIAKNTWSIIK